MIAGIPYRTVEQRELTERERSILRSIVQMYVLTANPVGSRHLSKYLEETYKLSPATIRNVMSDLEEFEFISHPHTSAGRVPTDKGYRLYVDSLMSADTLPAAEADSIRENLQQQTSESVLRAASKILGSLSHYLSVVELPHLFDLVIRRIQLVELSSTRILVVLDLDSNVVRTVTLEATMEFDPRALEATAQFLNQRIAARPISYVREHFAALLFDAESVHSGLLRLFTDSVDTLFAKYTASDERLHIAGTQNLLAQPEFESPERVRGVIELVENHDVIVHIFDKLEAAARPVSIAIGGEIGHDSLQDYSVITSTYTFGKASASIGVIGPKRMNYSRIVSILACVSEALTSRGMGS